VKYRLRTKITVAYLIPIVALVAGTGTLAYRAAKGGLEAGLGRQLEGVALTIAGQFSSSREAGRICRLAESPDAESSVRRRINELLGSLQTTTDARRIFVFDPELVSLLDTDASVQFGSTLFELQPDRTELNRVVTGSAATASSVLFEGADGSRYQNGYAAIVFEGETCAIVGVAGSASYFNTLDTYRAAFGVVGLAFVLMVMLISLLVSHQLTRPIGRLVEALHRYGQGELKEPLTVRSRDEIGYLAEAFNDMRESLDRRDEQMQLMLSGIAHEVRNPLAGMELFCSLLKEELDSEPEKQAHVSKISRELDYLGRVVSDFLSYARRHPLSPERFEALPLIQEVIDGVSGEATSRGVTIEAEVDASVEMTGEREALRGVCANLVQNAVQACSEGGRVTVSIVEKGEQRVIDVTDDGKGMDEEQLKKIFEPFYTTRQKGTGLGLALLHKTVQEHGGQVEVKSEPGTGTRFRIELPFDEDLQPLVHEPDYEGSGDVEMIG
jgi:signal transduction histidine kinase